MIIYSFENSKKSQISETGETLLDLFETSVVYVESLKNYKYIIPLEYTNRIDLITIHLYDSGEYVEELMTMNNIMNPFSMETDDVLYFTLPDNLQEMYRTDLEKDTSNKSQILNINKSKSSTKRMSLLPPSVNPGIKQVDIDYNKKTITVLNKFK